ncbi:unnamed protein product [Rangifer tarandus platyrhynchus]|uniref:Uncharacterized protein n=2 Tax=Rangifer tarandus platyrhynchus TaxID=3082113 RepID=A0ABN8YTE4_RANTA|nr:unnamed protein product [Rangifer tarandus platyrhynchus]
MFFKKLLVPWVFPSVKSFRMQGFKEEPFQQIPWVPTPPHPEPCKGAHSPGCCGTPPWELQSQAYCYPGGDHAPLRATWRTRDNLRNKPRILQGCPPPQRP